MTTPEFINSSTIELEVKRWQSQCILNNEFANWEVQVIPALESMAGAALRLKIGFPAEVLAQYKWPKDWREAMKERFAPKWLKSRWPVKYLGIEVIECYNKISIPKEAHFTYIHHLR